jgi:hypothetical protein
MAHVLKENKKLQSSVKDLEVRLTQTRYREEDLEVKVLALEKEHQLLEAENRSLTERLSHSANQQKGKNFSVVLWMFGRESFIFSCAELETELDLSREVVAQLQKEKEEMEEKADRVMRDLEGEGIFYRICSCSARNMF